MAASSTYTAVEKHKVPATDKLVLHEFSFVAGDNGSFIAKNNPRIAGLAVDVGVIFGDTAPNSLTVNISDGYGREIYSATGLTETQAAGALLQAMAFGRGLTVTLAGNTTADAEVLIVVFAV